MVHNVTAGYMGKSDAFDDALASFAMAYAVRTQRDYDQLVKLKRKRGIIAPHLKRGLGRSKD
jgi:Uncharacterized protein conserved in bacteria (DUF2252)